MRYVVCYDIADDARRERVAKALLDYGRRIQESVFLATLDGELQDRMMARLEKLVDCARDSVHVFALCGACSGRVRTLGCAEMPADQEFYVV